MRMTYKFEVLTLTEYIRKILVDDAEIHFMKSVAAISLRDQKSGEDIKEEL
jgi:hypothetical protein